MGQTSFLTEVSKKSPRGSAIEEAVSFQKNFPKSYFSKRSLLYYIVVQTAFITGDDPKKVIEYFSKFKDYPATLSQPMSAILMQTGYYLE